MTSFLVQEAASHRLDEIYRYTRSRWGSEQANTYITGLFEAFGKIETHEVNSRPVPAEFGVEGYYFSPHVVPAFVARVSKRRCGGAHGLKDAEGIVDTMSKRLEGVRPVTASDSAAAAEGWYNMRVRFEKHFVYWKTLGSGEIGIVTILHERMHQLDRFREDFE